MRKLFYGVLAGLVATVVLSALMWLKAVTGLLPTFSVVEILADLGYRYLGLAASPNVGWTLHFLVGLVWGGVFGVTARAIPTDGYVVKGMVFGVFAWLLMMLIVMPVAGAGLFAMQLGLLVPIVTLVLHLVFGAVMGAVYAGLVGRGTTSEVLDAHSTS